VFTEAEVQELIKERVDRLNAKYAGFDAAQQELAQLRDEKAKREEAEKTERQKEVERAVKDREKALLTQFDGEKRSWQVERAIERELNAAGISDPDVARLLVGDLAVTEAGQAKEKVAALLAAKPYLKPASNQGQPPQGAGGAPAAGASTGQTRMRTTKARIQELNAQGKWYGSPEQKAYLANLLDVTD
jgi:small-conductance mechanosensitive channel